MNTSLVFPRDCLWEEKWVRVHLLKNPVLIQSPLLEMSFRHSSKQHLFHQNLYFKREPHELLPVRSASNSSLHPDHLQKGDRGGGPQDQLLALGRQDLLFTVWGQICRLCCVLTAMQRVKGNMPKQKAVCSPICTRWSCTDVREGTLWFSRD